MKLYFGVCWNEEDQEDDLALVSLVFKKLNKFSKKKLFYEFDGPLVSVDDLKEWIPNFLINIVNFLVFLFKSLVLTE